MHFPFVGLAPREPAPVHPLQRTIDALAKSHNEAATPALIAALGTQSIEVFDGVVRALCARRSKVGHLAVLRYWEVLTPSQKLIVEKGRCRMGVALREALLDGDDKLFGAAYEFVEASGDYDLVPTLVMVAEQTCGERADAAVSLTLNLVDQLCRWLAAEREPVLGRDPETIRYCVLESLERSVERYRQHHRTELLEAFVVLAGPDSKLLRSILESPHHPCHQSIVKSLTASISPSMLRLLTTMYAYREAPPAVRNVVAKRTDQPFIDAFLAIPLDSKNALLQRNLIRTKGIACCEANPAILAQLTDEQQATAMRMLAASGTSEDHKLSLAEILMKHGPVEGRIAACEALRTINGQRANQLALQALQDEHGEVQAAAVRQLRERRIPGAMNKLLELVQSPIEAVSSAARDALWEFMFDNFVARFDLLDESARRDMGVRVALVDQTSVARLAAELANPARRHRLRAIEMAAAMGLLPKLADALIERLQDEDHMVRTAAADALQYCTADDVRNALLAAIGDSSVAVQMAARNSLRTLGADVPGGDQPTVIGRVAP
ncbi:HEAT repeat domain-containing protein [Lacipirellula sp.]|uniref:HEAT repeat domain-containing protein n=1 Tax=Lacipirellula sp. TaxID=2691419 RepID=UPI003D101C74